MLRGVFTALVTPFKGGAVDEAAYRKLVRAPVAARVEGVVVCGSTGEAATLSSEERERLVLWAVAACRGTGTAVWVGTGTNSTQASIELTLAAEAQGVAGAMIVAPYYNKPTQ